MQTISFAEARDQFTSLIDRASQDREPITIVRDGTGNVVLLAADEFAAMEETLHLFSTPANTERIRKGLDDFAAGRLRDGELCD